MSYVTLKDVKFDLDSCNKRLAMIVDVDGTLCDVSSITYLVGGPKKDFDKFHEMSAECPPNAEVVAMVKQARKDDQVAILVLTGRQRKFDYLTRWWMVKNEIPYDLLMMRPDGDFCKDVVLKKRMLDEIREAGFYVFGAIDDNPGILNLWQSERIPMVHKVPGWDARNNINGTQN